MFCFVFCLFFLSISWQFLPENNDEAKYVFVQLQSIISQSRLSPSRGENAGEIIRT